MRKLFRVYTYWHPHAYGEILETEYVTEDTKEERLSLLKEFGGYSPGKYVDYADVLTPEEFINGEVNKISFMNSGGHPLKDHLATTLEVLHHDEAYLVEREKFETRINEILEMFKGDKQ